MIKISINLQVHRFICVLKPGNGLVFSTINKFLPSSVFARQTLNLTNILKATNLNCKNFRYLSTSISKFEKSAEVYANDQKKGENSIIYSGALTYQVKGVKVFTCITSIGGIMIQPLMVQNILNGNNLPLGVAVFCCVGFFTFLTPFLIHSITKKYVTEIWYNSATNTYTATVLSFFLQKVNITFKIEDVTVHSVMPIFSTMNIKGKPVFIISDSFLEMEHYIKMMGYDKPLDLKLNAVAENFKRPESKTKSEIRI